MIRNYFFTLLLLLSISGFSQHFNIGFDMSFNDPASCFPRRDMSFGKAPWDTVTYFTGGSTACSGGLKHLTKIKQGGVAQSMLTFECGSPADIDFERYPYMTVRIKTTCNKDVQVTSTLVGSPNSQVRTYTVKGGDVWQTIRLDFGDQLPLPGGTTNQMHTGWNEPAGTVYPYEIYIDYIRFGHKDKRPPYNTGDPDTSIAVNIDTLPAQLCEKDAGQQSISLTGITNGTNVSLLSLSQTNTKSILFQGVPTFTAIQPAGTAVMNYTPKAGTVGTSRVHLVLTYTRDTVVKYKSVWFDINVISDPRMSVPASVKAQVNQPKAIMNVTMATNSLGGTSGLSITATATNASLITNLLAETVKSDGTSKISFIPGQDLCGYDVITAIITDSKTGRTATYEIAVEISSATCIPSDTCTITVPGSNDTTICSGKSVTLTATGGTGYRWYNSSTGGTLLGSDASYTTPVLTFTTSYYVTNYNGTCESVRIPVDVTVANSLSTKISALANTHFVCNSSPEQLSATPSGGVFSGDGVEMGYFVPSQAKLNHINSIYYTYGDTASGCSGKDSLHVFVFPCIGLENNPENGLRIYPNPASGIFTVEMDNINDELTVQIFDATGRLMLEDRKSDVLNYSNNFDLSAVSSGIYTVKAIMNNNVISSKIIINP